MTNLTLQNYDLEVERERRPVVICVHDKNTAPPEALDALCAPTMKCCRLNAEHETELAQKFRVLRLPATLLLENGQIVQRIQGERSLHDLANILNLN